MDLSSKWYVQDNMTRGELTLAELLEAELLTYVVVVLDAHDLDEFTGYCFIFGKKPQGVHLIQDGIPVRFYGSSKPDKKPGSRQIFAYPYNPIDLQLDYTLYAPEA